MARFEFDVDMRGFIAQLDVLDRAITTAATNALRAEQRGLFNDSQLQVPVLDGNLKASGEMRAPNITSNSVSVEVAYGGSVPYALRVHENPRSGQTRGIGPRGQRYKRFAQTGKWKYLEHPLFNRAGRFTRTVGTAIMRDLQTRFRG